MRHLTRILTATLSAVAILAANATVAAASEPIEAFSTATSTTEAGGHPDLETSFALGSPGVPESAKEVEFDLPTGIFGNPNAIPRCASVDFAQDECDSSSQAGLVTVYANYSGDPEFLLGTAPIYDIVPQTAAETARFSFIIPMLNIPVSIPVTVRTETDYGLRFTVAGITQLAPLASAQLKFWGFPADPEHTPQRFPKGSPGNPAGCPGEASTGCIGIPAQANITVAPLTDNPTTCSGAPLTASLSVRTYQDPANPSGATSNYPAVTGCEKQSFHPVLEADVTTDETDAPSGLDIELHAPQSLGHAASPSEIRSATVTLPPGLTINPDAADGQTACADAQAGFGSERPAECPDNAKIGTFRIGTPALSGPLTGSMYFGEPKPGDQYRLFMIASGFGINAKLVGSVQPDPTTGQLVVHVDELPQVPFDDFQLHLFASDRGLMATPTECGLYPISATFVPWNESLAPQTSTQDFSLDTGPHGSPCPERTRPFNPSLEAGTSDPVAGAHSSFALLLNREDGDQFLGKLNFTMPPGLTATLRGITYCPDASIAAAANVPGRVEQATPSCPASSQIGTTNVAAGPGTHPFHAVGKMYLAGPFQGAALSLVAITPALAGPYDYGTVVIRVALHVDPTDAHVVADSETVPSIIGGVPIRMRSIQVNIDKPDFMINPTNCSPFSVLSQGIGDQGTVDNFASYFHVVNCAALGFDPKMTIAQLGGHRSTRRAANPGLRFDLRTRDGDANIRSITVTLPKAFEIDQRHLGDLCAKAELESTHCAGRQPIGTVKTETPLLDHPLEGSAYAVTGYGGLPHVVFILGGQVTLLPQVESKNVDEKLRTEAPIVPDAPIGHFRLTLFGGKHGYLRNTRALCSAPAVTVVKYTAQNGKSTTQKVATKTNCGSAVKRSRGAHAMDRAQPR